MRNAYRFAVLALIAFSSFVLTGTVAAQVNGFNTHTFGGATIHGTPPSVTSIGFGGHPGPHGVPPSVTSLNFGNTRSFGSAPFRGSHFGFHGEDSRSRHHRHAEFFTPFWGGYYLPYAYDYAYDDPGYYNDDSMERYPSGPTIFDRTGAPRAPEPQDDYRAELTAPPSQAPTPVADQPNTVLIFKDGHQQEVKNYAIVASTLYDLSDGRTHKVPLAELDLPATVKQNDERGIAFDLPAGTKLN